MNIKNKGVKKTAFALVHQNKTNRVTIRSNKIYGSGGYQIEFDAMLNGNTLEVTIQDIIKLKGYFPMIMKPATGVLFKDYVSSSKLNYILATRTIEGPSRSKLEIILKDNYQNPGTEDKYECVL